MNLLICEKLDSLSRNRRNPSSKMSSKRLKGFAGALKVIPQNKIWISKRSTMLLRHHEEVGHGDQKRHRLKIRTKAGQHQPHHHDADAEHDRRLPRNSVSPTAQNRHTGNNRLQNPHLEHRPLQIRRAVGMSTSLATRSSMQCLATKTIRAVRKAFRTADRIADAVADVVEDAAPMAGQRMQDPDPDMAVNHNNDHPSKVDTIIRDRDTANRIRDADVGEVKIIAVRNITATRNGRSNALGTSTESGTRPRNCHSGSRYSGTASEGIRFLARCESRIYLSGI